MNLSTRSIRKRVTSYLVASLLLAILPGAIGPIQTASAAPATSLTSNTNEAKCASTASDTSSAKLDVILDGNYCVLRFLSSTNTWTPPSHLTSFRFLAIGGGGAGGWGRGGGGGAGGFYETTTSISQSSYSISVGAGGVATGSSAPNGGNTSVGSITVGGGGGGGGHDAGLGLRATEAETPTVINGSGGGTGMNYSTLQPKGETVTITLIGVRANDGAGPACAYNSPANCAEPTRNTGGGGGASSAGYRGKDGNNRGGWDSVTATLIEIGDRPDGGEGASSDITGRSVTYAGGGGGSVGISDTEYGFGYTSASYGRGKAGGGNGSYPTNYAVVTPGGSALANSGSGGGGGAGTGGNGGSGIVIIRFQLPTFTNDSSECTSGIANTSASVLDYSTVAGDCVLIFSTPDSVTSGTNSWTVPYGIETVSAVIIGGGGGGGAAIGGGGGGGQVLDSTTVPLALKSGTTYSIKIGKGGTSRGLSSSASLGGMNGESSTISAVGFSLTALGGGGAAGSWAVGSPYAYIDKTGWTSGGDGLQVNWASDGSQSANKADYPVGGSNAKGGFGGGQYGTSGGGGGGGGAGGPGGNAFNTNSSDHGGGNGGSGLTTTILGYSKCFGGGGGGGGNSSSGGSTLSTATCGGAGGTRSSTVVSYATPDTGGGGGGGGSYVSTDNGGRGGTGLIIIRFKLANPTGASQSLNMACHSFSNNATTVDDSISSNYYLSRFASDSTTSEFSFPASTETGTGAKQDWGSLSPAGCGTNGANFTLYMWGYLRSPSLSSSTNLYLNLYTDMAANMRFDGVPVMNTFLPDYENVIANTCTSTGDGSGGTYNCGSAPSQRITKSLSMEANSWHFVEIWLHERDPANRTTYANALNASFELIYQGSDNIQRTYPRSWMSKSVPRNISTSISTDNVTAIPALTASVDTSKVVYGGINETSTPMSMGGKFSFYENGIALSACQNISSTGGSASCIVDTVTASITKRYFKVVFTPDSSTASTDLQYNVFATTIWDGVILVGKLPNAKLRIGQYIAFTGVSSYPLNVYGDGSIYGDITRSLIDSGTANCSLDASKFFLTASRVGSCSVSASAAGDATHLSESTTATIYWIQWSDAYATRVPSTPTEIVLQHKTQITKYNFDTLTVTSYKNGSGTTVTEISAGSQLRIIGDGFNPSDNTTEVVFGNAEIVDMTYSSPALQVSSDGSGGYYLLVTVPSAATTDAVIVNSRKGTAAGPVLTILSP